MQLNHTKLVQSDTKGILQALQQVSQQYLKKEISLQEYYQKSQQYKLQHLHIKLLKYKVSKDNLNYNEAILLKQHILKQERSGHTSNQIKLKLITTPNIKKNISTELFQRIKQNKLINITLHQKYVSQQYKTRETNLLNAKIEKFKDVLENLYEYTLRSYFRKLTQIDIQYTYYYQGIRFKNQNQ
ncbi:Aspartate kinase I domain-containing protein [Spironucleus salmonicida]|uniref:Aspartate kinase I domain-containing protein n=1 Tax=Spironucleus salmonicida TaxID=348837 RepID=V6M3Y0_9EUKA|nr:Aspartate kinase I domain-containing protein [Spironucleus salmonicida]|eukprot:EST48024.1 Aspartate kinase I domain-containing protein [Spironucleus salmonicida]